MKILSVNTVKILSSDIEVDPIQADMYPMPVSPEAMRDSGSNVVPDNGTQAADVDSDKGEHLTLLNRMHG